MEYVYPHKEKGRPRTKQLKYIDSSEVVYESEEQMDSYEMEDEDQVFSPLTINSPFPSNKTSRHDRMFDKNI